MINIVIPMAGAGSRFSKAGYALPKPFIDVNGEPMIQRVMKNLAIEDCRFVLIMQQSHYASQRELINELLRKWAVSIALVDGLTEGTACTVLSAKDIIDSADTLIIANSDQIVDIDISTFIQDSVDKNLDGSILTFIDPERNPKWSFAKLDSNSLVCEVQEKKPISEYATIGIYLFKHGYDFVRYAEQMILQNDRVNNEFYTCPVYNYLVRDSKRIGIFNIESTAMHGIGTPEDLEKYLELLNGR